MYFGETAGIRTVMINDVERNPSTWTAAVKLALIVSSIASLVAAAITVAGDVPQAAIVLPVILVAFTASWIQTGRHRAVAPHVVAAVDTRHRARV